MVRYGLIGKSLKHSYSKKFFDAKFSDLSAQYAYSLIELDDLVAVKETLTKAGLSGFNITIPYKKEILPYCDALSPAAEAIGAVNCVRITSEGLWLGFNTDMPAIRTVIQQYDFQVGDQALVLGTGGAALAVEFALHSIGVIPVKAGRSASANISYAALKTGDIAGYRFIIQCTPLGMYPAEDQTPDINYDQIHPGQVCIDLIYNPPKTLFLNRCLEQGAVIENGQRMLELQAEFSWNIWQQKHDE